MKKTESPQINEAIELATSAGNFVKDLPSGWSKARQVAYMTYELTPNLKQSIQSQLPSLRYWSSEATPHNFAEEGFMCDESSVAISFPLPR